MMSNSIYVNLSPTGDLTGGYVKKELLLALIEIFFDLCFRNRGLLLRLSICLEFLGLKDVEMPGIMTRVSLYFLCSQV